jgi:hypothetical protein
MEHTLKMVDGRLYNPETSSFPVVFHFNGGAKSSMQKYEQMWVAYARTAAPKMKGGGDVIAQEEVRVHVGNSSKNVKLSEMCKRFPQALKTS